MITFLSGILSEKSPTYAVLNVHGVGYEVLISTQTFSTLPDIDSPLFLYTYFHVREDAQQLFGFTSQDERSTFRQLLKVSGIGAKTALSILSVLSWNELADAIGNEDVRRLSAVPGIGKKTAERLILELRGKLLSNQPSLFNQNSQNSEIVDALLALGYNEKEVRPILKNIPQDSSISDAIRLALKQLSL